MAAGNKSDFFLSRRGSVAAVAREVADLLIGNGYDVVVQDYDIPLTANFVEAMHEAIKNSRDLVVLFTRDYESSPHTRREFTSFEADRAQSLEDRRLVILRCEDVPLRGLFAPNVYQDLVGVDEPEERRRRILAAAEGQSQALKPPPRPFVGVPPRLSNFIGREAELDRLDASLIGGDRPTTIVQTGAVGRAAVHGLGGVGKTSLAVEYAYRYRDLYAGVWWCRAEMRAGLLAALAELAAHLGVGLLESDPRAQAQAGLRRLAEQRATWLLVYDNLPSPDGIADLLPAAGAKVLITSRFFDWEGWADEIAVDALPLPEAVTFLEQRAARADRHGAAVLAEALGRLPLALDHAGAFCKRTQMPFAEYAANAADLAAKLPRGTHYPRSIAATFDLAIAEAAASCPAAEALMAYLAHCAPERIPLALLDRAIDDRAERMAALLALSEVSLIKSDPFPDLTPAVSVHRLVRSAALRRAEANGLAADASARLLVGLTAIYPVNPGTPSENLKLCWQLAPHIADGQLEQHRDTLSWARIQKRIELYSFYRESSIWASAIAQGAIDGAELYGRYSQLLREADWPNHPDAVAELMALAGHHEAQGELAVARTMRARALEITEVIARTEEEAARSMPAAASQVSQPGGGPATAVEGGAARPKAPADRTDIDARARGGTTALHDAVRRGDTALAEQLLAGSADVNAADDHGDTALHLLARRGSADPMEALLRLLLSHGAAVDARNNAGDTPLHLTLSTTIVRIPKPWAGGIKYYEFREYKDDVYTTHDYDQGYDYILNEKMASLLVAHSADVAIRNNSGATVTDKASEFGLSEQLATVIRNAAA